MISFENLKDVASRFGKNGDNLRRRTDVLQPQDEIITIADEFYYSEPKFGKDGEKKEGEKSFIIMLPVYVN